MNTTSHHHNLSQMTNMTENSTYSQYTQYCEINNNCEMTQKNVFYADGIEIVVPRAQSHYYLKDEEELSFNGTGSWNESNEMMNRNYTNYFMMMNQMIQNEMVVEESDENELFVHRSTTPIPFEKECEEENYMFYDDCSFDEEFLF